MNLEKSDAQFSTFLKKSEHGSLVDLWLSTHYGADGRDVEALVSFSDRREAFLWALERLLKEEHIKLHQKGHFWDVSLEEQVNAFRGAWPKSKADSGYDDFYWWFFDPACPAGVAWRQKDGSYLIAD
jgi:hypothetical protein